MDKLDKIIQQKLKDRTLEPSPSAWERLRNQLDKKSTEKPKRKRFLYIGYAASVALLLSFFWMMKSKKKNNKMIPKETIVDIKVDSLKKNKQLFLNKPIKEVVVTAESSLKNKKKSSKKETKVFKNQRSISTQVIAQKVVKNNKQTQKKLVKKVITNNEIISSIRNSNVITRHEVISKNKEKITYNSSLQKRNILSKITINPEDLLYEVTHTKKEIKKSYYATYNISRKEVLYQINTQLKKSKIKIDPETILTEVERDVSDDFFKNHFLEKLKSKVSSIMVAIVERNH